MWTVRAWDRGQNRVPWVVVKLLRLLRQGDLGALLPEWRGWTAVKTGLVSPEGYTYRLADLNWWGLTCKEAEAWRNEHDHRRAAGRGRGTPVTEPPTMPDRGAALLGEPRQPSTQASSATLPAECLFANDDKLSRLFVAFNALPASAQERLLSAMERRARR